MIINYSFRKGWNQLSSSSYRGLLLSAHKKWNLKSLYWLQDAKKKEKLE